MGHNDFLSKSFFLLHHVKCLLAEKACKRTTPVRPLVTINIPCLYANAIQEGLGWARYLDKIPKAIKHEALQTPKFIGNYLDIVLTFLIRMPTDLLLVRFLLGVLSVVARLPES